MIGRTNATNAASPLAFSIVGGTTEPTGREGLIWVNTGADITGWVFSATEPSTPMDGLLWIETSSASAAAFSATAGNLLMVYPVGAKQYDSGDSEWDAVTAKIYLSNAWVAFQSTKWYFKGGEGAKVTWATAQYESNASVNVSTASIQLLGSDVTANNRLISTDASVDVTNMNTLCVKYKTDGSAKLKYGLSSSKPNSTSVTFAKSSDQISSASEASVTLDVSEMTGSYYIVLQGLNAGSAYVYDVFSVGTGN